MKRNLDLARNILLEIERCDDAWGLDQAPDMDGYSEAEVSYHIKLLNEANLLEAQDVSHMGPDGFCWIPGNLTWAGHEFLDAARDDDRWNRTKKLVISKSGGLAFEAVKHSLMLGIKSALS